MEGRCTSLEQEDLQGFVMLRKDGKSISRVKCSQPSIAIAIAIPPIWDVTEFIKNDGLPTGLHCIRITPDSEDARQRVEWRIFLHFMKQRKKVAVANTGNSQCYILPPPEDEEYSYALVMYSTIQGPLHRNYERTIGDDQPRQSGAKPILAGCNVMVHSSYLKTLGQTHSDWIFGAIAEFVDNSRDAKATRVDISIENIFWRVVGKKIPMLAIVDDGHGMSHEEIVAMVSIGRKQPDTSDSNRIGRYGVGFKSGAMRLGKDALVLTQTTNSRSIAFLSQSLNEGKDNVEIPIVSYYREGQFMEFDTVVQPKDLSKNNLKHIMEFSPFDKYFIGEKAGLFDKQGTGTQLYIWNLDEWGSNYSLEWSNGMSHHGDISICPWRVRSRVGQMTLEVPLDYSLKSYLEVLFLDPRMKIYVQGSMVKSLPLARFLHKTSIENGFVLGKPVQLILGHSQMDLEQGNCGIFLYWHGRLIEAYKRVGTMIYNGEKSHGIIGVIDVTNVMDDSNGRVWVHNNKQGFVDGEPYALLKEWLSEKANGYLDHIDKVNVRKRGRGRKYKPDHEWVQCDQCRKWRMLPSDFNSKELPQEWFCYMRPFNGKCEIPEEKLEHGVIIISSQRSGYNCVHACTSDAQPSKRRRGRPRKT